MCCCADKIRRYGHSKACGDQGTTTKKSRFESLDCSIRAARNSCKIKQPSEQMISPRSDFPLSSQRRRHFLRPFRPPLPPVQARALRPRSVLRLRPSPCRPPVAAAGEGRPATPHPRRPDPSRDGTSRGGTGLRACCAAGRRAAPPACRRQADPLVPRRPCAGRLTPRPGWPGLLAGSRSPSLA